MPTWRCMQRAVIVLTPQGRFTREITRVDYHLRQVRFGDVLHHGKGNFGLVLGERLAKVDLDLESSLE